MYFQSRVYFLFPILSGICTFLVNEEIYQMTTPKSYWSPLTILMGILVLAAVLTWLIPAGSYKTLAFEEGTFMLKTAQETHQLPTDQRSLDSLGIRISLPSFKTGEIRRPVAVPGSYQRVAAQRQGWLDVLKAPIKGIYEAIDVIVFLLFIGGFIQVFYATGALDKGIMYLTVRLRGRYRWLILILGFLFSLGGATFGMAEESLAFYPVLVPIFLAAGYDLIVPVAVLFMGTAIGNIGAFTNPFSTILAAHTAGVDWTDGLYQRLVVFFITTGIYLFYVLRYAERVRRDPTLSLVGNNEGIYRWSTLPAEGAPLMDGKTKLLLLVFLATFIIMVIGVVRWQWWLTEMTVVFFGSALIIGFLAKLSEKIFVEKFVDGAAGLLGVSLVIGFARGVTIILNEGLISDTLVFQAAQWFEHLPPGLFVTLLFILFLGLTLFIASTSSMAVLTMPILGALAVMVNVPGREVVNAYIFGMGIMNVVSPVNLALPSLALVGLSYRTWLKFSWPLLVILALVCLIALLIGLKM